jgi:hypothetical protein
MLLTDCNGKMIWASIQELVSKVEIVDFAQHQEKYKPQQTGFEDAVEYPKAINSLLENP